MAIRLIRGALLTALAGVAALGQTANSPPAFDTISIKTAGPSVAGHSPTGISVERGQIAYMRQSLISLLLQAYDVRIEQLSAPAWMYDVNKPGTYLLYNIAVTMPPDTPKQTIQLMLRNLLTDRFHIRLHHETRNFPGYDLVVADGGAKLIAGGSSVADGGFMGEGMIRTNRSRQSMTQFAATLGEMVNESNGDVVGVAVPQVTDKTGLTGIYAIELEFAGWQRLPGMSLADAQKTSMPENHVKLPDLFAALEKQLGLRLVKADAVPLDVLVIDHADPVPDAN